MSRFEGDTTRVASLSDERQGSRLLRMNFPRGDGPQDALMLVNSMDATESMSRDFQIVLEVLSDSAYIGLKEVLGKRVTVAMVRDDAGLRHFNGYVCEMRLMKTDGGFGFYRMVLRPWLAALRLRRDCATFMDMSMSALCEHTFGRYDTRDFRTRILDPDPVATMQIQHNETDHNHLHRRLEARGWHYWYEHRADGHTLWLGDDTRQSDPIDGASSEMVFRDESGAQENDGIDQWSPTRHMGSARATVSSYDFKSAGAQLGTREARDGAAGDRELFEDTGAYAFNPNGDDGDALAQRRMEECDARAQYFKAGGNDRRAQPGRWFTLDGHFSGTPAAYRSGDGEAPQSIGTRKYLILSVRHIASNNYHVAKEAPSSYTNTFKCLRRDIPWRPGRGFHSKDTRINGLQTAVVVGPPGEDIHTDKYGRVKVQFHWDRAGQFDPGSSAWVRVMTPWAGAGFGQISLPRIGDEVVVQFLGGNCDRPLIVGSVYNARRMPPWDLPAHKTQSGILSRSTVGGQAADANTLRFEDRIGKNGAQLASSHQHSELNLGWLAQPNSAGTSAPRGEGAELRSDAHIALRARKGLLLSAWKRADAGEQHLARDEYLTLVDECLELVRTLGKYAAEHQAMPLDDKGLDALNASLKRWENGSNTAPTGQEGGAPAIAITAPAGISFATPQTIVSYAGLNLDTVAQQHLQMTAGQRINLNAGKGISLFSHTDGIAAIAHNGKLLLQSQHDDTEINAAKNLKLTATEGKVTAMAKVIELIAEDGSFIKIGAGSITFGCTSPLKFCAPDFVFDAPVTMASVLPVFSAGNTELKFAMKYEPHTTRASTAPAQDFDVALSDASAKQGRGGSDGNTELMARDAMHTATLRVIKKPK